LGSGSLNSFRNRELTLCGAKSKPPAFLRRYWNRHESRDGLTLARNDYLFANGDEVEHLGKTFLGFLNIDLHMTIVAKE